MLAGDGKQDAALTTITSGAGSAFATFQRLTRQDSTVLMERFGARSDVQREVAYFREKVAKLKEPDDLFKDRRLMRFVLSAFTLEDDANAMGKIRKVLLSKITDPDSFANRLIDKRYAEMAGTLLLADFGVTSIKSPSTIENLVNRYLTNSFEKDLGQQNSALREASYFLRKIGGVTSALDILGDKVLRSVVTYTLDLPQQIALQSVQKQRSLIDARLDVSKFRVEAKSAAVTARSLDGARSDVAALDRGLAIASAAKTQVEKTIAKLQAIKDDYARVDNIQNPSGPYATEIPVQEAAAEGLTRQAGLLAAAEDAMSAIAGKLARMDQLVALARDPANASSLAGYKSEFAALRAAVHDAVAGATYRYDDGDPDAAGSDENLLDGSMSDPISVAIKSTGEQVTIRAQDLSGLLGHVDAADTAFQAVADAGDTSNLDLAQTGADSAKSARTAASNLLAADRGGFDTGIASVAQWAATLKTDRIYPGYQALRDAGARIAQINTALQEVRSLAQQSAVLADGADRSAITQRYAELVTQIDGLVNTAGNGFDNLLAGPDRSYELLNSVFLHARGRDLNTNVVSTLSTGDLDDAASANALIAALDATVDPALAGAAREIKLDSAPFSLAANTLDARARVDGVYRSLTEEMPSIVAGALSDKQNLLATVQSDIIINLRTSGHVVTISARTNFDADITQILEAGADLLPSSAGDASGALARIDEALFNAKRMLSQIGGDIRAANLERTMAQVVIDAAEKEAAAPEGLFQANDFAMKFIKRYLIKKDLEAVQGANVASLLFGSTGQGGTDSALAAIAGLAGKSRFSFTA